jgi:hypothetical protein
MTTPIDYAILFARQGFATFPCGHDASNRAIVITLPDAQRNANSIPIFAEAGGSLRAGVPTHALGSDCSLLMKAGKPARMPTQAFASTEARERLLRPVVAALSVKFPMGLPGGAVQ